MDTVIDFLGGACALGSLMVLTAALLPWGPFRRRWHAALASIALLVIGGTLLGRPPERPKNVSQAEWARRIALCRDHAVGTFRDCVRDPRELKKAAATAKQATSAAEAGKMQGGLAAKGASSTAAASASAAPPSDQTASKWAYGQAPDRMRGKAIRGAQLLSDNELEFAFPYDGGSRGTLEVRQGPTDGLKVLLFISKGQFTCGSLGGSIHVKFDHGPVRRFWCASAADGSTNVIFIRSPRRFVSLLKRSSTLIVEAGFFQAGARQLDFDVRGLDWK